MCTRSTLSIPRNPQYHNQDRTSMWWPVTLGSHLAPKSVDETPDELARNPAWWQAMPSSSPGSHGSHYVLCKHQCMDWKSTAAAMLCDGTRLTSTNPTMSHHQEPPTSQTARPPELAKKLIKFYLSISIETCKSLAVREDLRPPPRP